MVVPEERPENFTMTITEIEEQERGDWIPKSSEFFKVYGDSLSEWSRSQTALIIFNLCFLLNDVDIVPKIAEMGSLLAKRNLKITTDSSPLG
uniref:DUF3452 domain-containing protein n=1 Tax=Angiostrongylus cantonensis TaxID=6313 RepID=A0A0K0DHP4_ANGCA